MPRKKDSASKAPFVPTDDEPTVMRFERSDYVTIGKSSVIGSRSEQQDAIITDNDFSYLVDGRMIAILCDGMGGMNGGGIASQLCTATVYADFHNMGAGMDIRDFFDKALESADRQVHSLKTDTGMPLRAGTTLVSVAVDNGKLYIANVGDSHGYLIRNGQMSLVTEEHNYLKLLLEEVASGNMTLEQAKSNPKKDALISYVGMGGLRCKQVTDPPLVLRDGDYVILCSDGLYRSVPQNEILDTVIMAKTDVQRAADELTKLAISKGRKHQDNTSVVVLLYTNKD